MIKMRQTLHNHGVMVVAVLNVLQTAIRRTGYQEPSSGQRVVRQNASRRHTLLAHGIITVIHWVLGHSRIPGNAKADILVNLA